MFRKLCLTALAIALGVSAATADGVKTTTPQRGLSNPRPVSDDGGQPSLDKQWKLGVDLTATGRGTCVVSRVYPGSPAADIGLKVGDVVTSINGQPADDPTAMRDLVFANNNVEVKVGRNGMQLTFDAEFETKQINGPGPQPVMLKVFLRSKMTKNKP
jgi:S1-C subfamily serine protease